jgi:predicted nucleic acid-binding protein
MRVYLDTWVLRGIVSDERGDKEDTKELIRRIRDNSHQVIVPQIVIAETFSTIMRDYTNAVDVHCKMKGVYDQLSGIMDFRNSLPSLNPDIFMCAQNLQGVETRLKDTDSLILAHAILDPISDRLITHDAILLHSNALQNEIGDRRTNGLRSNRLKIVDGL